MEAGADLYRSLLAKLAECSRTNTWPGYDDPDEWSFPIKEEPVDLVIAGQKVSV